MGATGGFSDGRGSFPDRGHQESTQGITEWHPQRDPLAPKRKGCRFWPRRKPRNPQEPQGPRDYTELYREHGLIPRG